MIAASQHPATRQMLYAAFPVGIPLPPEVKAASKTVILELDVAVVSAQQPVNPRNIRCQARNSDHNQVQPAPYQALHAMAEFMSN